MSMRVKKVYLGDGKSQEFNIGVGYALTESNTYVQLFTTDYNQKLDTFDLKFEDNGSVTVTLEFIPSDKKVYADIVYDTTSDGSTDKEETTNWRELYR